MPLSKYGVLKGTIVGHKRDADDDHYQILVSAGNVMHRIAVNVKSSAPKAPSTLLFYALTKLPEAFVTGLQGLNVGYTKLASKTGGLALDYVRNALFKASQMKEVPPDTPGDDNDLKDKLETAVLNAVKEPGSIVYAFGAKWGPEPTKKDEYFKFLPGNGIHDIHMNQGNSGKYKKDNGTFQDGGLVFEYPNGKWQAFFFAFQSQIFNTDEQGNPVAANGEARGAMACKGARKQAPRGTPRQLRPPVAAKKARAGAKG
jgi:uncharacterized protein YukJ